MTKVGEGSTGPVKPPSPEEELKKSVGNFKQYMKEYNDSDMPDDKQHSIDQMASEMTLMDVAGQSATKKEIRVQEQKVAKDFEAFQENPNDTNSNVLQHDINTLGESLEH